MLAMVCRSLFIVGVAPATFEPCIHTGCRNEKDCRTHLLIHTHQAR